MIDEREVKALKIVAASAARLRCAHENKPLNNDGMTRKEREQRAYYNLMQAVSAYEWEFCHGCKAEGR